MNYSPDLCTVNDIIRLLYTEAKSLHFKKTERKEKRNVGGNVL